MSATTATTTREQLVAALKAVPDPELPAVTIADLGILREVEVAGDEARVVITPTYSGCPAMEVIRRHLETIAARHGYRATVTTRLSPAWTTDWMSERGRAALRACGIVPPGPAPAGPVGLTLTVRQVGCPLCGSPRTEELARFGGTSCKALRRCLACREPFEEFKAI